MDTTTTDAGATSARKPSTTSAAAVATACLLAWMLPPFLFPTLHKVHEYYRLENGVFLLFALAAILSGVPPRLRLGLTLFLVLGIQVPTFWLRYGGLLKRDDGAQAFGAEVAKHTKPDDVLLIYDREWNPEIAYYAGRRAVMCTTLAPVKVCEQVAKTARIGAIIGRKP